MPNYGEYWVYPGLLFFNMWDHYTSARCKT
jgi:hypothetical protein